MSPADKHAGANDSIDAWNLASKLRKGDLENVVFKARGRFTQLREAVQLIGSLLPTWSARSSGSSMRCIALRGIHGMEQQGSTTRIPGSVAAAGPETRMAQLLSTELDGLCGVREQAEIWLLESKHRSMRRCAG